MEVYLTLHFVLRAVHIAACGFAGWWIGQIIGAIINRETLSKEYILNLVCAEVLKLVCGIILWLYY